MAKPYAINLDPNEVMKTSELLKPYTKSFKDRVIDQKGRYDELAFIGESGDFWPVERLCAVYMAIKDHIDTASNIIQIAGGASPLLHAIDQLHPDHKADLIALDMDASYQSYFSGVFEYEYLTGDAARLDQLGIEGKCVVYSYHFLDMRFFNYMALKGASWYNFWKATQGGNIVRNIISGMVESLPVGSVLVTQVLDPAQDFIMMRGLFSGMCSSMSMGSNAVVWKELNRYENLGNRVLYYDTIPEGKRAVVMVSEKIA